MRHHAASCGHVMPWGRRGKALTPPRWWGAPLSATRRPVGGYCSMKFFENFAKNHSLKFSKIFKIFRLRFFAKFSKISGCDFLLNFGIRSISRAFTARRADTRDGDFYSIVLIFCAPVN